MEAPAHPCDSNASEIDLVQEEYEYEEGEYGTSLPEVTDLRTEPVDGETKVWITLDDGQERRVTGDFIRFMLYGGPTLRRHMLGKWLQKELTEMFLEHHWKEVAQDKAEGKPYSWETPRYLEETLEIEGEQSCYHEPPPEGLPFRHAALPREGGGNLFDLQSRIAVPLRNTLRSSVKISPMKLSPMVCDLNANHVTHRVLMNPNFSAQGKENTYHIIMLNCVEIGMNMQGCCMIQRCLESAPINFRVEMINALIQQNTPLGARPI